MASQNQHIITTLPDGKLCDFIDGTIRNDTPKEHVRQRKIPIILSIAVAGDAAICVAIPSFTIELLIDRLKSESLRDSKTSILMNLEQREHAISLLQHGKDLSPEWRVTYSIPKS